MIDKNTANQLSAELQEAVNAVLAKHGLQKGKVRATYGDYFKFSVEATLNTVGDSGVNETSKEAIAYKRFFASYGLPEGILGKNFTAKGKTYKFAGIAISRSKYPFVGIDAEGNRVFFTEQAKSLLV